MWIQIPEKYRSVQLYCYLNMASTNQVILTTELEWIEWLTEAGIIDHNLIITYADTLVEAQITNEDLSELNHEILKELKILVPGHRTKI